MKHNIIKIILLILLSILFFYTGFVLSDTFYNLFIPTVAGTSYQVTEFTTPFKSTFLISFVLALIPISIFTTWKLAPVITNNKRILTVVTVILCMLLSLFGRRLMLKSNLKGLTENLNTVMNGDISYPLNELYFEYYLFGGLCLGCLLSVFLFKQHKRKGITDA